MSSVDLSVFDAAGWRVSTYSGGGGGGSCVEVADAAAVVGVRDTKDRDGGVLVFKARAWSRFVSAVKADVFA